jgi:hypothetical protein
MSQYGYTNKFGNQVIYGLDKPTGGYFWQEIDAMGKIWDAKQGLGLTDLLTYLRANYDGIIPFTDLMKDFLREDEPTPLQIFNAEQFGNDIVKMLENVKEDVNNCIDIYAHKI